MAYWTGSEAVWLEEAEAPQRLPRRQRARSFEVIEGEGLDARARQGVGVGFVALLLRVAMAAAVLLALGVTRVTVSSATVSILKDNATKLASIKTAQSTRADLEVQRSVLSAGTRIDRIATQNLGMVLASSGETIDVSARFPEPPAQDGDAEAGDAGDAEGAGQGETPGEAVSDEGQAAAEALAS